MALCVEIFKHGDNGRAHSIFRGETADSHSFIRFPEPPGFVGWGGDGGLPGNQVFTLALDGCPAISGRMEPGSLLPVPVSQNGEDQPAFGIQTYTINLLNPKVK